LRVSSSVNAQSTPLPPPQKPDHVRYASSAAVAIRCVHAPHENLRAPAHQSGIPDSSQLPGRRNASAHKSVCELQSRGPAREQQSLPATDHSRRRPPSPPPHRCLCERHPFLLAVPTHAACRSKEKNRSSALQHTVAPQWHGRSAADAPPEAAVPAPSQ